MAKGPFANGLASPPRNHQLRQATKSPAKARGESLHRDGVSLGCSFRET